MSANGSSQLSILPCTLSSFRVFVHLTKRSAVSRDIWEGQRKEESAESAFLWLSVKADGDEASHVPGKKGACVGGVSVCVCVYVCVHALDKNCQSSESMEGGRESSSLPCSPTLISH